MENKENRDYYADYNEHLRQPMTTGEWFIAILVAGLPLIGIIMLIVWAFSSGTNINKANWAKAMLLWAVIGIVLAIVIFGIIGIGFLSCWDY